MDNQAETLRIITFMSKAPSGSYTAGGWNDDNIKHDIICDFRPSTSSLSNGNLRGCDFSVVYKEDLSHYAIVKR
jgi:hypothetical protein